MREGELTASGAWSWFGDPRSVYHEGAHRRTFTGWVARDGSVQVASYDHDTGQRVVATLRARLQIDDHNNPSILVRPDGRLLVFWSTPAGPSMWYRRFGPARGRHRLGARAEAPDQHPRQPRLHLPQPGAAVGRGQPNLPVLAGRQLQPVVPDPERRHLDLEPGPDADPPNPTDRPYVKHAGNGRDTIAMAFTQATRGRANQHLPRRLDVFAWGTRRLDLFATDAASHGLVQRYFDGRWHGPVRQDFGAGPVQVQVQADPDPRSAPIPVSEQARLAG